MILGIDPGLNGALAWVTEDSGHLITTLDMPTIEVLGKKRVSPQMLTAEIELRRASLAVIEETSAMPGQGVTSMYNFGLSAGLVIGVVAALKIPIVMYRPSVWKRQAGVPADKNAARQIAQRLWPGSRAFDRVKDDGRAEAALLARWVALKGETNA